MRGGLDDLSGVRFLLVPYDRGARGRGMGAGALFLVSFGLIDSLKSMFPRLCIDSLEVIPRGRRRRGWDGVIAVNLGLCAAVEDACGQSLLPVILGGGCLVSLGVIAGLGETGELGVLWLDAHGDLNTPETSPSGCIEGMPLALLLGRFGGDIRSSLNRCPVLEPRQVVLMAARDLDPGEVSYIEESGLLLLTAPLLAERSREEETVGLLAHWAAKNSSCYLHIDVDCMDVADVPAVMFPSPGGLPAGRLSELLGGVLPLPRVRAVSVTAVYPEADSSTATVRSVTAVLAALFKRTFDAA